jgi:hypothetical protein
MINPTRPCGCFIYHLAHNLKAFYVLPTRCCMALETQQLIPYRTFNDWVLQPRRGVFTARYELNLLHIIHVNLSFKGLIKQRCSKV